jgi:hypothetical protein
MAISCSTSMRRTDPSERGRDPLKRRFGVGARRASLPDRSAWRSLAAAGAIAFLLCAPSAVRADAVLDWNAISQSTTASSAPPLGARNMAIVQAAVFDAVNSILGDYSAYAVSAAAPSDSDPSAAAMAAAHYALVQLYPAAQAGLDAAFDDSLAAIPDGMAKTDGVAVGESVAQEILALRATDGSGTPVPYTPGSGPGVWKPTPPAFLPALLPGWGMVTPFLLETGDQYRLGPPPALTSGQYTLAFQEVKTLGSATAVRTQEQSDVPRFWLPPGTQGWNSAARQVAAANGTSLSENARIFALLNMGGADAVIACWDTKFTYNFWRPVTAIRAADTDGNPATDPDPSWSSFVVTPPFPEYVSGHACYAGAAKYVLERFFGRAADKDITLVSSTLPGVSRTYTSFRQIADEIDNARVWGGIHFRFSVKLGRKLGKNVGRFGTIHHLLPVPHPDDGDTTGEN